MQKKHDHHGQREVCNPGTRNAIGKSMNTGPTSQTEHQGSHTGIKSAIDVQEFWTSDSNTEEEKKRYER